MDLYFDIETIPTQQEQLKELLLRSIKAPSNYKDPEKISAYIESQKQSTLERSALRPEGEIVCIGMAFDDEKPIALMRHDSFAGSEKQLLEEWIESVREHTRALYSAFLSDFPGEHIGPRIIGHNIIGFDIPKIYQRCVVNDLHLPPFWPRPAELSRWKCRTERVLDTMYNFSQDTLLSLETLAIMLNIPVNQPLQEEAAVTGADVYELWKNGGDDLIREHCIEDVRLVREIAARMK